MSQRWDKCDMRLFALILIMLNVMFFVASSTLFAFSRSFSDINGNFAEPEINMLLVKGIVRGDGERFFPDKPVSRAEFVKMLVTVLGYEDNALEIANYSGVFSDTEKHWAAGYITTAWELGIARGDGGRFYPDRNLNRAEMVSLLLRAFGEDPGAQKSATYPSLEKFSDFDAIPGWAKPYVSAAVEKGIVSGMPDGRFEPGRFATRAEAAKVTARIAARKGYIYDFSGTVDIDEEKPKTIKLEINSESVEFELSGDVVAYSGNKRADIRDLQKTKVYIILNSDGKVSYIKSGED